MNEQERHLFVLISQILLHLFVKTLSQNHDILGLRGSPEPYLSAFLSKAFASLPFDVIEPLFFLSPILLPEIVEIEKYMEINNSMLSHLK